MFKGDWWAFQRLLAQVQGKQHFETQTFWWSEFPFNALFNPPLLASTSFRKDFFRFYSQNSVLALSEITLHLVTAFSLECFAVLSPKSSERVKELALVLATWYWALVLAAIDTCWRGAFCEWGGRDGRCRGGVGVEAPLSSQRFWDYLRGTKLQVADLTRHLNMRFDCAGNFSRQKLVQAKTFPGKNFSRKKLVQAKTFPGKTFPGKTFSRQKLFQVKTSPGKKISGKNFSR